MTGSLAMAFVYRAEIRKRKSVGNRKWYYFVIIFNQKHNKHKIFMKNNC